VSAVSFAGLAAGPVGEDANAIDRTSRVSRATGKSHPYQLLTTAAFFSFA